MNGGQRQLKANIVGALQARRKRISQYCGNIMRLDVLSRVNRLVNTCG